MEQYFMKAAASELERIAEDMQYLISGLEQSRQNLPAVWSDKAAVLCIKALDDLITCSHNQYENILILSTDINLESEKIQIDPENDGINQDFVQIVPENDGINQDFVQIDPESDDINQIDQEMSLSG